MNDELHNVTTVEFWVLINHSFVGAYRRFGGACFLYHHDTRIRPKSDNQLIRMQC